MFCHQNNFTNLLVSKIKIDILYEKGHLNINHQMCTKRESKNNKLIIFVSKLSRYETLMKLLHLIHFFLITILCFKLSLYF